MTNSDRVKYRVISNKDKSTVNVSLPQLKPMTPTSKPKYKHVIVHIDGHPVYLELPETPSTDWKDYIPYASFLITGLLYLGLQFLHLDKIFDVNTVNAVVTGLLFFITSAITTWRHNPVTKKAKQKQVIADTIKAYLDNKE